MNKKTYMKAEDVKKVLRFLKRKGVEASLKDNKDDLHGYEEAINLIRELTGIKGKI